MPEVTFRSGEYRTVEHVAAANIAEGQVVVIGTVTANTAGEGAIAAIAHRPIENTKQGSLAIFGGEYDVVNLNNAANGKKVYWDDTNNKVTTVSTNNAVFGWIVSSGGGGANSTARAFHNPYHNVN